jgi:ribonuclease J
VSPKGKLKIIPLGGVEEIGKNIYVIEYADDILVVDCGSIFPKEDMLGIDLVIPDVTYLQRNRDKIRGILVTHGHEDHIGAIPYVVKQLGGVVPIYGTRLTLALIELKLKEHRAMPNVALHTVKPGSSEKIGAFDVDFIKMSHSIAGAVAMAIKCSVGTIVVTGDFKVDYTPVDGERMDFQKLAELGKRGVLALLMDSTNVERSGYTMSEKTVGETFNSFFPKAEGRIIIAMFASNVHRIQQVVDSAQHYGRKVCLTGRSMINVSTVAMQLGELHIPSDVMISIDDLDRYPDEQIVVITTGSQGEQMSGLTRMAFSEHRKLDIKPSDMVIISANPIPGNELSVSRVIDQLLRKGANVIYESLAEVHVSGHACQEELKLMHALIKPKFFIPVHGEYRMLSIHKRLAMSMGMPEDHIVIPRLGDVIEVSRNSCKVAGAVPAGAVLVDGLGIGDVGNVVLRDRRHLSQDGLMTVVVGLSKEENKLVSGPDIVTRGFVYVRENEELMVQAREVVKKCVQASLKENHTPDWGAIKGRIRDDLREFLYQKTKRSPMILPIIMEV